MTTNGQEAQSDKALNNNAKNPVEGTTKKLETESGHNKSLPWLFSITSFIGAFLIFTVEFLSAKLLLPQFGGSASLWSTANLFFQVVMLAGYLYVHVSSRKIPKRQAPLIATIAIVSLVALPIVNHDALNSSMPPVAQVLLALLIMVGLPFAVLTTTGPLLQRWYSQSNGPRHNDPYFIYASSNAGSFLGLISYPLIWEPWLGLKTQGVAWSALFVVFLLLMLTCWWTIRKPQREVQAQSLRSVGEHGYKTIAKWILLAFIPSSLFLAFTHAMTSEVGSIPLLWVIPLGTYLLTMVIAFAVPGREIGRTWFAGSLVMIAIALLFFYKTNSGSEGFIIGLVVVVLTTFVVGYTCHRILAVERPEATGLTGFYVLLSVGGALGGLLNSVIAPLIFNSAIELPLTLLTAIVVLMFAVVSDKKLQVAATSMVALVGIFGAVTGSYDHSLLLKERTFYGEYRYHATETTHFMISGSTLHGVQSLVEPKRSLSYYSETSGVGRILDSRKGTTTRAALVGLGSGTLASYGQPGDHYTFMELDPKVAEVAQNPSIFTYLRDTKAKVDIKIGDGRLSLESLPNASEDVIVLDAFNNDSVPTHFLTEEAFRMYGEKLAAGGVVAVHASNRSFDLGSPIIAGGRTAGFKVLALNDRTNAPDVTYSKWFALVKDDAQAKKLIDSGWVDATDRSAKLWTDDYAPLMSLLVR